MVPVPVPTFEKVTVPVPVPVPVPAPYLDHKKQIFQEKFLEFFLPLPEGNQIYNFISSSGSGNVINYGSGFHCLTSYGSGSTSQKVTVPTVPVPFPQRWKICAH